MTTYAIWSHSTPAGYLTNDNIKFVQDTVTAEIARFYNAYKIVIPKQDVIRIMIQVMEIRRESVPKMNRRAVIKMAREFINFVQQNRRVNYFSNNVWSAFQYDGKLGVKPYSQIRMKTADSLGEPRQLRFHYTY